MTKKEIIKKAQKSDKIQLLLFKTNKKTNKKQLIKHSCRTAGQLEDLVKELMISEFEHYYNIEIV
jgi:hypothetical protein